MYHVVSQTQPSQDFARFVLALRETISRRQDAHAQEHKQLVQE